MSSTGSPSHPLAGKKIIVIGGGIAGLAFVSALERQWPQEHARPELIIYERSPKDVDRGREGYTMSIKRESGLLALERLGLLGPALRSSTVGIGQTQPLPTVWDSNWRPLLDLSQQWREDKTHAMPAAGIRLVRYVLRNILLDSLPARARVFWGTACKAAYTLGDGRVAIGLENGSKDECDLLIAADGANSIVRQNMLPDQRLVFAGAICFMGSSNFPSGKPASLKGQWGMNISGEGVTFLTFPVDDTTGIWGLTYTSDQPRERIAGEKAIKLQQEILDEVRRRGYMFDQPFNTFIESTDPPSLQVFNAMHKSPIQHAKVLPKANVVLIGDSNHPMSPFSGNGANMALMDAVVLGSQLAKCTGIRAAVDAFDLDSVPRSQKAISRGPWTILLLHSRGVTFWVFRAFIAVVSLFIWLRRLVDSESASRGVKR